MCNSNSIYTEQEQNSSECDAEKIDFCYPDTLIFSQIIVF